jgi:hypothetical protein
VTIYHVRAGDTVIVDPELVTPPPPPVPGALTIAGFGARALASLGTGSYVVSTLAGTGAGSFPGALAWLNAGNSGRVTFSVDGTIDLGAQVRYVTAHDFLIDGRGRSITFTGGTVYFRDSQRFAVVNVRHRGGWSGGQAADNWTNVHCSDFAYLNCSASGSYDEGISSTGDCRNYSLVDCLFGPGGAADHNYGSLNYGWTANRNGPGSFIRNVWVQKDYRNPKAGYRNDSGDTSLDPAPITYDVVNNIAVDCNYGLTAEYGAKVNDRSPYNLRNTNGPKAQTGAVIGSFPVPSWADVQVMSPTAARDYAKANSGALPHDAFDAKLLGTF